MAQKNKNLTILLVVIGIIIVAVYGRVQNWLPLKIQNNSSMPAIEQPIKQDISAKLEVGNKKYQAQVKAKTTVYDLMRNLQTSQGLKFNAKEYAGLGALVEEINGIKNDVKANKFWFYYINGQSASQGISSYILKNNDVITWKYEVSKF